MTDTETEALVIRLRSTTHLGRLGHDEAVELIKIIAGALATQDDGKTQ